MPKAAVTLTEESTNTVSKTAAGESGDYILSYLKPGTYKIQFAAAGFKEHVETGIVLQISQSRRVDPVLQVGEVSETVQVTASAAQVNYVSPEIGQAVDADQLINLPEQATSSRGRSPFLLAKLLPGQTVSHSLAPNRAGWLQVLRGRVELQGNNLAAGDGAAVVEENRVAVQAVESAEILLFDLA